jgi:hypothetical protein
VNSCEIAGDVTSRNRSVHHLNDFLAPGKRLTYGMAERLDCPGIPANQPGAGGRNLMGRSFG